MADMRPRILAALVIIAGAAGAGAWWWLGRGGGDPAAAWTTAVVDRGTVSAKVTASGTLSALVTVTVGSQVSGRIQDLLVDYNDQVRKGQVLARIDPLLFDAAVAQASASLAAAKADVAKAKAQVDDAQRVRRRQQALLEQRIVTQADLDTATTDAAVAAAALLSAEAKVQQAQASLDQARTNLLYTTISSPIDGMVISRSVDVGQTVAASLQAPTLFTIAEDLRKMQVDTNVAEADVGRIRTGMAAGVRVDAFPDEPFTGSVRQVRNAAQTVSNVVTYDAVIDVANPELRLRPGMTATVTFTIAEAVDALRVPNAALRFRPPAAPATAGAAAVVAVPAEEATVAAQAGQRAHGTGDRSWRRKAAGEATARPPRGKRTLQVLRGGRLVPVEVVTGVTDGSFTEIVSGAVLPGDLVVTGAAGAAAKPRSSSSGRPPGPF